MTVMNIIFIVFQRLKTLIPRQIDLDFDDLVTKYTNKQRENEEKAMRAR